MIVCDRLLHEVERALTSKYVGRRINESERTEYLQLLGTLGSHHTDPRRRCGKPIRIRVFGRRLNDRVVAIKPRSADLAELKSNSPATRHIGRPPGLETGVRPQRGAGACVSDGFQQIAK